MMRSNYDCLPILNSAHLWNKQSCQPIGAYRYKYKSGAIPGWRCGCVLFIFNNPVSLKSLPVIRTNHKVHYRTRNSYIQP
jgi:hypothetical protein